MVTENLESGMVHRTRSNSRVIKFEKGNYIVEYEKTNPFNEGLGVGQGMID